MIVRVLTCLALAAPVLLPSPAAQEPPVETPPGDEPEDAPEEQVDARTRAQREEAAANFTVADYNGDGWISFREARQSLELDRTRFHVFDADGDGRITLEEFTAQYIRAIRQVGAFKPPIPNPDDPNALTLDQLLAEDEVVTDEDTGEDPAPPPVSNVLDLFGQVVQRAESIHASPEPDQIVGPVPSFRRVDYDNSGGITRPDLVELARGSGLDVRINTILAAIDADADGAISEAEFYASMSHAK